MPNTLSLTQEFPSIAHSDELWARAQGLIPSGTQTLAKGPQQYVNGVAPKYARRAKGSHIWDVDGNEYIDYNMGIGPVSLGYAYPAVDEAIRAQLEDGITFSLMHPLEVDVAELIREVVPHVESVRFSKAGNDAASAAVRLARAYTGKSTVLCCGYHGWHDWYIAVTDRNAGIPAQVRELTYTFQYNDIESVIDSIDDDTACVILEPVVFEEPENNFLHELREVCDTRGILLIFDEMWTGFRIALGGAQEYFGVRADLVCFSKAVANGMPLSILAGRKDVMQLCERDVFFYTTFGGETLSLAAAKATIEEMKAHNVPAYLHARGRQLKEGLRAIITEMEMPYIGCSGLDYRTIVSFDASAGNPLALKSLLQQELIKRGILWSGFHTISFSHSKADIDYTLEAYAHALRVLREAVDARTVEAALRGAPVEPVFRKTGNFNTKSKRRHT